MRSCKFKVKSENETDNNEWDTKIGWFHTWGLKIYDSETSCTYSIGICEDVSGKMYPVFPENITFSPRKEVKDPILFGLSILASLNPEIEITIESDCTVQIEWDDKAYENMPNECREDLVKCGWKWHEHWWKKYS